MEDAPHDLVIGGSGMLAGLVESVARTGRSVSVVARGPARLQALAARHPNIHPLPADYNDEAAFEAVLRRQGRFSRCVAWMHDDSKKRALQLARQVCDRYCQVLGSASADPARSERLAEWRAAFAAPGLPKLRVAVLGFVVEGARSRWLMDDEICTGVARALESDEPVTIVGTVTPWSARP